MNYVEKVLDGVHTVLNLNAATLSGAIDIVVVPQEDGTLKSTPFHVRFGKLQLLNSYEKIVTLTVNGEEAPFKMKLGSAGEAFFVEESEIEPSPSLVTSPIGSPPATPVVARKATKKPEIEVLTSKLEELSTSKYEDNLTSSENTKDEETFTSSPIFESKTAPISIASKQMSYSQTSYSQPSSYSSEFIIPPSSSLPNSSSSSLMRESALSEEEDKPEHEALHSPPDEIEMTWKWGSLPTAAPLNVKEDSEVQVNTEATPATPKKNGNGASSNASTTLQPSSSTGGTWTGKVSSLFRIFKGNSTEQPQYLVKPESDNNNNTSLASSTTSLTSSPNGTPTVTPPSSPDMNRRDVTLEIQEQTIESNSVNDESNETESSALFYGELEMDTHKPSQSAATVASSTSSLTSSQLSDRSPLSLSQDDSNTNMNGAHSLTSSLELPNPNDNTNANNTALGDSNISNGTAADVLDKDSKDSEIEQSQPATASTTTTSTTTVVVSSTASTSSTTSAASSTAATSTTSTTTVVASATSSTTATTTSAASSTTSAASTTTTTAAEAENNNAVLDVSQLNLQISKCGHLLNCSNIAQQDAEKIFKEHLISYEQFNQNPEMLFDHNILFKINNKIYPWNIAAPVLMSMIAFHKPLDSSVVDKLEAKYAEKNNKSTERRGWSSWLWRSRSFSSATTTSQQLQQATPPQSPPLSNKSMDDHSLQQEPKVKEEKPRTTRFTKKTLRPTSEQLKALKLHPGPNQIKFTVTSKLQGTQEVRATIYLWDPDTKIVISDIDGTITKSDVFGQILPIMGKDWSHSGVAQLYSNISANNYQILYLTARPIGQANLTRGYISTLKQGDIRLPYGPVFMSPNRLLSSLNQEVILRRPEEFKIACLKDIKSLFPPDKQPFYAGFGNRPTDALSYRAVSVALGKIFTINYTGEISTVNYTYKKTFSTLNELVDEMFPMLGTQSNSSVDEEWNTWNYWKPPLHPLPDSELKKKK